MIIVSDSSRFKMHNLVVTKKFQELHRCKDETMGVFSPKRWRWDPQWGFLQCSHQIYKLIFCMKLNILGDLGKCLYPFNKLILARFNRPFVRFRKNDFCIPLQVLGLNFLNRVKVDHKNCYQSFFFFFIFVLLLILLTLFDLRVCGNHTSQ